MNTVCIYCKQPAAQGFSDCKNFPRLVDNVLFVCYCGMTRQKADWGTHRSAHSQLKDRQLLYHVVIYGAGAVAYFQQADIVYL